MNNAWNLHTRKGKVLGGLLGLCLLLNGSVFASVKPGGAEPGSPKITSASTQDPWGDETALAFQNWDPEQSFRQMRQALNQMLDWTEQTAAQQGSMFSAGLQDFSPALDAVEQPDRYLLKLDLPGMDKDKLDIRVTEHNLAITGERRFEDKQAGKKGFARFERSYGYFQRNIPIPENVKTDEVTAKYDRGVLEIVMPKLTPTPVQEETGRKVAVA